MPVELPKNTACSSRLNDHYVAGQLCLCTWVEQGVGTCEVAHINRAAVIKRVEGIIWVHKVEETVNEKSRRNS